MSVNMSVALPLVLGERVALAHGPQPDPCTEVVHVRQVIPPLVIDDRQDQSMLDPTHQFGGEFLFALLITTEGLVDRQPGHLVDRHGRAAELPHRQPGWEDHP